MGSLRELLDKQKREKDAKANGNSKPVLQLEAKSQIIPQEAKPIERTTATETTTDGIQITKDGEKLQPTVVEQRPPAGLSGIALIKWKREHAATHNTNKTQSAASSVLPAVPKEKDISHIPPAESKQLPPAETAVPEKKNDGIIDTSELRRNLEYLANNIEQKELVGQIVRTIAKQLKDAPELCSFMLEADVDLMVRGLRRSYSVVARKKSETKDAKEKSKKGSAELDRAFKDAGLDQLENLFK